MRRNGTGRCVEICCNSCAVVFCGKGWLKRQQLVQRDPQRVDVSPVIDKEMPIEHFFGRDVPDGTHDITRSRQADGIDPMCQTKISHIQMSVVGHQQIGGFDVTVHDTEFVCMLERRRSLPAQSGHKAIVHRWLRRIGPQVGRGDDFCRGLAPASPVDNLGHALAGNHPHHVVMQTSETSDGIHGNDVRMFQRGRRPRLVLKSTEPLWFQSGGPREDLDRHAAIQRDLLGRVDNAHASSPDLVQNPKVLQYDLRYLIRLGHRAVRPHRFGPTAFPLRLADSRAARPRATAAVPGSRAVSLSSSSVDDRWSPEFMAQGFEYLRGLIFWSRRRWGGEIHPVLSCSLAASRSRRRRTARQ